MHTTRVVKVIEYYSLVLEYEYELVLYYSMYT